MARSHNALNDECIVNQGWNAGELETTIEVDLLPGYRQDGLREAAGYTSPFLLIV